MHAPRLRFLRGSCVDACVLGDLCLYLCIHRSIGVVALIEPQVSRIAVGFEWWVEVSRILGPML